MQNEVESYKGLVEANPLVKNVISPEMTAKIFGNNQYTVSKSGRKTLKKI